MVRKKIACFLAMAFLTLALPCAFGQENLKLTSSSKGICKANIGLSQTFLYNHESKPLFADAFAELFVHNFFSIKGSFYQYIADRNNKQMFQNYSGIAFGGALHTKHISHSINDFSLGFQPGIAWVNISSAYAQNDPPPSLIPNINISLNYTLFFSKNCNFYFSVAHQSSFLRGTAKGSVNLSGLSITGGLGFHFQHLK